jgi:hypothetical protein
MDVYPSRRPNIINESSFHASQAIAVENLIDCFGNTIRRMVAQPGSQALKLTGVINDDGSRDEANFAADAVSPSDIPPRRCRF